MGWPDPGAATDLDARYPRKHIRHPALGTESRRLPAGEDPSRACGRDGQTDGERSGRETCSSPSLVRQSLASLCGERGGGKRGKGSRRGGEEAVGEAGVQLVKLLRLPLIFSLLAPLRADTPTSLGRQLPGSNGSRIKPDFFFFLSGNWRWCVFLYVPPPPPTPPTFFFFF